MGFLNWLWWVEKCKSDLVWRWFWNAETRYFLAQQWVFMNCLLCALYWTRCKSPSVKKCFCLFLSNVFKVFFWLIWLKITGKDSLRDNSNITIGFGSIFTSFCYKLSNKMSLPIILSHICQKKILKNNKNIWQKRREKNF